MPKNTVLGYAKRNPLVILTPEREFAEEMSKALHLTTLSDDAPSEDAPREDDAQATQAQAGSEPRGQCADVPTSEVSTAHERAKWEDAVDLSHIKDENLRREIMEMMRKHAKLGDGTLGTIRATEHHIPLEYGTWPIRSMPYRQGPAMSAKIAGDVQKMLNAGVIEPATSEWASPVVLVPKKDRALRFCVDYRRLNAKTLSDAYPLPRMDDCIDPLGDATVFTTLDCNSGYWQIPVAPEDRGKTTFTMHMGTFRYLRMPFGLKGAPATFRRALDIILSSVRWQLCLVYLDDVIIFSRSYAEHVKQLDQVLTLMGSAGISLKLKKCDFFKPSVSYLGHVIAPGKLSVAEDTAAASAKCTFLRTLTQVRSFLGACNVYRRFVKCFAKIARPLTDITRKDADPDFENPIQAQLDAFKELKKRMVSPPVLALPRLGKPYMIDTDASAYQLGCTLLQEQDEPGDWRPVGYWSYSLNDAERNYSATERECYAVVWAIRSLRPYIEGTKFTVRTDHDALRWLMTLSESSGRLTRWRLRLAQYDFEIQYRPGRVHQVPYALSRLITSRSVSDPCRHRSTTTFPRSTRLQYATCLTSLTITCVPNDATTRRNTCS